MSFVKFVRCSADAFSFAIRRNLGLVSSHIILRLSLCRSPCALVCIFAASWEDMLTMGQDRVGVLEGIANWCVYPFPYSHILFMLMFACCDVQTGDTCLHIASYKGHLEVVKFLVQKGGKKLVAVKNKAADTAQDEAKSKGRMDVFAFLKVHEEDGKTIKTVIF